MRRVGYCIFLLLLTTTCLPLVASLNANDFSGSEANNCTNLPCVDAGEILFTLDANPIKIWKNNDDNYLVIGEDGYINLYSLTSAGISLVWNLEVDLNGNISCAEYYPEYDLVAFGNETGVQIVDVGPNREKGAFIFTSGSVVDVAWDPTAGNDIDSDGITDIPYLWIALEVNKRAVQYDINNELPRQVQTNEHLNHIGSVHVLLDGTIITGGDDEIYIHTINQVGSVILNEVLAPYSATFDLLITNDDESELYVSNIGGQKLISYEIVCLLAFFSFLVVTGISSSVAYFRLWML